MSSTTMPSVPSLLLAQRFKNHEDETAGVSGAHHGHDDHETPGTGQDFVLAVIESALKILGTYEEDDKEENSRYNESDILLLPQ